MSTQLQTQAKAGSKSSDTAIASNAVKRHFSGQRGFSAEAQRYPIQAKLKIGQPGDKYEQEADQVAEQVMRMPEPKVQRMCSEYKEELKRQPLEEEEEEEELIQTKIVGDVTPKVTPAINSGIQSLQGGGRPMSRGELSFFEPRFGTDFSNVRVHNDSHAASVARSVNARAFTLGRNVVFGAGQYTQNASSGRKLLAHELTHVVQQNGGATLYSTGQNSKDTISNSQELKISPELLNNTVQFCDGGRGEGQGIFPINLENTFNLGNYSVVVRLQGDICWDPFGIRITGEENGIIINEGDEERGHLLLGSSGEFSSLGIDTGTISANFDSEGLAEAQVEALGGTLNIDRESREVSMTLDVLGIIWPERMQELVEEVGEVTTDFTLVFHLPEGSSDVTLQSIEANLGITLGPEQLRALAELNILTEYEGSRVVTTAEGSIQFQINLFGLDRDFPILEGAYTGGNIDRAERAIVQFALREALNETGREVYHRDLLRGMRPRLQGDWVSSRVNLYFLAAYQSTRLQVVEYLRELGWDNADEIRETPQRDPVIEVLPIGTPNAIDGYYLSVIQQIILPNNALARRLWRCWVRPFSALGWGDEVPLDC